MKGIEGKVALITGGAQGIGLAIANRLAGEGAHTILADISKNVFSSFQKLYDDYPNNNGFATLMDVTNMNEINLVVEKVVNRNGKVDILINSAGILLESQLLDTTEETWDRTMDINVKSVLLCSQAVLPYMIKQKDGRIVNLASQAGKSAESGISAYCTSKAAVIRLTQCIAVEMVEHNIRANCVSPGATDTDMMANTFRNRAPVLGITPEEVRQRFYDEMPMKRMAYPEEIANVVTFLASDESSYMTGQALNVTGGRVWY
jgi:NAD(P)-dependent dehydrogenase (short-subunit alcohol dehydrogenase family)